MQKVATEQLFCVKAQPVVSSCQKDQHEGCMWIKRLLPNAIPSSAKNCQS